MSIEEMRPVQWKVVSPILVARTPLLGQHCKTEKGLLNSNQDRPVYFSRGEAVALCGKMNCRLPKEHEWEYFYRAGNQSLFPFGDELPADYVLDGWLSADFSDLATQRRNEFGLYGLFDPEWCDDVFTVSLAPGAEPLDGSHVIRGGAACFWPWQDEEWVWCMSAMRSPSSALEDGRACVRLVRDVDPEMLEQIASA